MHFRRLVLAVLFHILVISHSQGARAELNDLWQAFEGPVGLHWHVEDAAIVEANLSAIERLASFDPSKTKLVEYSVQQRLRLLVSAADLGSHRVQLSAAAALMRIVHGERDSLTQRHLAELLTVSNIDWDLSDPSDAKNHRRIRQMLDTRLQLLIRLTLIPSTQDGFEVSQMDFLQMKRVSLLFEALKSPRRFYEAAYGLGYVARNETRTAAREAILAGLEKLDDRSKSKMQVQGQPISEFILGEMDVKEPDLEARKSSLLAASRALNSASCARLFR